MQEQELEGSRYLLTPRCRQETLFVHAELRRVAQTLGASLHQMFARHAVALIGEGVCETGTRGPLAKLGVFCFLLAPERMLPRP